MYPPAFDYRAPATLEEALALLAEGDGAAKVLAGGASLVPLLKVRLAEPAIVVDVTRIPGLAEIAAAADGSLRIGALTRQAALAGSPAVAAGALDDARRVIADPLVRNVGTVGGNLAHGDPANDHPAVMLALGAAMRLRSTGGERVVDAGAFHLDLFATAIEPDELLVAIELPAAATAPGAGSAYVKFERQVGDYAIAAAAAWVRVAGGRIAEARVAFTNLAPVPRRTPSLEAALVGAIAAPGVADAAAAAFDDAEIDPWDDPRATASVKRRMARGAARRAIARAVERAVAGAEGTEER